MPLKGTVTVGGVKFAWGEVSSGTQRSIKVAVEGVAQSDVTYSLKGDGQSPGKKVNIHETDVYKKGPGAFYPQVAEHLGALYNTHHSWPHNAHFDIKKETVYCDQ